MSTTVKERFPESTETAQLKQTLTSEANIVQPPIGISDFRKLIKYRDTKGDPYLFIDKSLFIKEILDDGIEVKLITRPRRFGKTLNMSMLHHFLASEIDGQSTKTLFEHLKITEHKKYLESYQGKYPVVFMTLKDVVRENNYEIAYKKFASIISSVYAQHGYLLSSQKLDPYQKKVFESVLEERATPARVQSSLRDLTQVLYLHYDVKPWVLIDEYDTPIQTARAGGYYKDMVDFMRGFLGAGLKDNVYLERAVLTGILRIAKESLFSDLNNIKSYSLLHSRYGEYFGFTEPEVIELLEKTQLNTNIDKVRNWYNGYRAGDIVIYNPWSIINYIEEKGSFSAYWVNTSGNVLIKDLLIQSGPTFKFEFESLLQGNAIEKFINENIVFENLENNEAAVWTLLVMSGYLKIRSINTMVQEGKALCQLEIPNREVRSLYQKFIFEWLSGINEETLFYNFLKDLLNGNLDEFENNLQRTMLQTFSVYDIKGKMPEKFFHGFMLGLVAGLDPKQYQIHSNKESGYGRFDISIIPKNPSKLGIIFEIKSVESEDPQKLKEMAHLALQQIDEQNYGAILTQHNIKDHVKIGVVFNGKTLAVEHRIDSDTVSKV